MKQKLPFVLEIIWLLVAIFSIILAVVRTVNFGLNENVMFYVIATLSCLMYVSRRYLRKTREGVNQGKDQ